MTITLKDFFEVIEYKLNEGYDYLWTCFGPNAHCLSHHSADEINTSVSVVFDSVTRIVYEMEAWDASNDREYRWIHPNYIKAYKKECKSRGVKFRQSIDDKKFIELEVEDDIIGKARAIVRGEEYDTRVSVPLDLDHDTLFTMMQQAHESDMTLNDYVAFILQAAIDEALKGK